MNKKGVTLIEIIVAVAIVGIISTAVANVFIFGNKSFKSSDTRSSRQMDVRIAAQTISEELKYANEIELFKDRSDIKFEYGYKYIYFNDESKKLMKKNGANDAFELLKGDQMFDNSKFLVEDGLLKFSVISQEVSYKNNYEINSAIGLLNQDKELATNSGAKVIRYKTQNMELTYKDSDKEYKFWDEFMTAYEKDEIWTAHGKNMEKRYYTKTGKDGEEIKQLESIVIAGDNQGYGGMIFRDIKGYVEDINDYIITIDAHTQNTGGGWGILLNGLVNKSGNDVKDNGYMLQFDPGANGLVIRQIYNGNHSAINDVGVKERSDKRVRNYNNSYFPSDFVNEKFKMEDLNERERAIRSKEDAYFSPSWTNQRYRTEIKVKIDNSDSMLLDVTLIDSEGNRSNTVKFGDFGTYILNEGNSNEVTVEGNPLKWQYDKWNGVKSNFPGSFIGLRSWNGQGKGEDHETKFYGIEIKNP